MSFLKRNVTIKCQTTEWEVVDLQLGDITLTPISQTRQAAIAKLKSEHLLGNLIV